MNGGHDTESGDLLSRSAAVLFRQSLTRFGGQWRRVVTNSMYPVIGIGDWIFVEAAAPGRLKRGDIVLFYRDGFVVHRVMKVDHRNTRFHEKGDRVPHVGIIPFDDLIGRVSKIRKADTVIDLTAAGMKVRNRAAAVRSFAQLFWFRHFHAPKTRIAESLPAMIRTPLHRATATVRKLARRDTPFGEHPWHRRTESVTLAGQTMPVSIAPDNRDIGAVVDIMRREPVDHAVICIFMDGITATLLRYFTTVELRVLLFANSGGLLDSIGEEVRLADERRCEVRYVLFIPPKLWKELAVPDDAVLVVPHDSAV